MPPAYPIHAFHAILKTLSQITCHGRSEKMKTVPNGNRTMGTNHRVNRVKPSEHLGPAGTQREIDEVLTLREVAANLRCSKAHVANVINGRVKGVNPLPAIAMGRRKLIRRSTLERWKRANESSPENGMLTESSELDADDA